MSEESEKRTERLIDDDESDLLVSEDESSSKHDGWFSKKNFRETKRLTRKRKKSISPLKKKIDLALSKKSKTQSLYSKIVDLLENDTTPPTPQKQSEDDSFLKILTDSSKGKKNGSKNKENKINNAANSK